MNRITRLLVSITALALLASACSGSDDETADAPATTTEAPASTDAGGDGEAEPTETTAAPATTTAAPTTTEAATTTTEAPTTTSSTTTTTTEAPDTEAPPAPTGLACGPGGGSGEVTLWWDEPDDPSDIETIQIYVNENGAGFVRLHTYTQDQLLNGDAGEWMANVVPVAYTTPIEIAVTYDDAAGNESGWNPIDAWVPYAGGTCNTGAPDTPSIVSAIRGGGSGEVDLRVDVSANDVVSWVVEIDQGGGFTAGDLLLTQSVSLGEYVVTLQNVDHTLPAEYRVRAVDDHGNASGWGTRSCPVPISPGDVPC